jgi:transglutaminase-like putative cysteine protease
MKTWNRMHLALTLLAFWSTLSVALTGELMPWQIGPPLALLPLAYALRNVWRRVPSLAWDAIVFLVLLALLPMTRQSLLNAAVLYFMALQVVKCFSFRRLSDAYSIYLISLFEILSAAVLTTSPVFGFAFIVYVLLLIRTVLLHMTLDAVVRADQALNRATEGRRASRAAMPAMVQRTAPSLAGFTIPTLLFTLLVLAGSCVFFLLVPRLSVRNVLQTLAPPPPPPVSAFDENIEFGKSGRIQLDQTVALYVKPVDEGPRPSSVRLRGVALDSFDGKRWERTSYILYREPFGEFSLRPYPLRRNMIVQPATTSRFLFGETFPLALMNFDMPGAVVSDPCAGSCLLLYPPSRELHYTVLSRVETLEGRNDPEKYKRRRIAPSAGRSTRGNDNSSTRSRFRGIGEAEIASALESIREQLTSAGLATSLDRLPRPARREHYRTPPAPAGRWPADYILPTYRQACLTIPDAVDRTAINRLALEATHDAQTTYQKAMALERYLRANYQYSLDLPAAGEKGAIENFLFRSRRGHCEYFATAMVMLLRSLDIPARIVNGYYSTEWNNIGGMFTVRQRDAHSWVEAFFDDYGWMTFDPTPPDAIGRPPEMNPIILAMNRYYDALKLRWYRAVIDFSIQDQQLVARGLFRAIFAIGDLANSIGQSGGSEGISVTEEWTQTGEGVILVASVVLVGVVIFLAARRVRLPRWRRRGGTRLIRARQIPRFYAELLEDLRHLGYVRRPPETAMEFALRVTRDERLRGFETITFWYYAHRFGHFDLPAEAQALIAEFRHKLHAGAGKTR